MLNCGKLISFLKPLLQNHQSHKLLRLNTSLFSSLNKQKDQLLQLSTLLASSSEKYSSSTLIRYLSILVISPSSNPQLKDDIQFLKKIQPTNDQIDELYDRIASDIHRLTNKQVNEIMQIMLQRGEFFNRRKAIFRSIDKNAKSYVGFKAQPDQIYHTVRLLDSLKFPASTTQKFLINVINPEKIGTTSFSSFPPLPQLQMTIYALQNQTITLSLTQKIMEGLIKCKVQKLDELALLYHIGQIVKPATNLKLKAAEKKIEAKKILFNPFIDEEGKQMRGEQTETQSPNESKTESQISTEKEEPLTQEQIKQMKKDEEEYELRKRLELQQLAGKIVGLYESAVDQNKLQESIIKSIHSQVQPLNKRLVMFLSSMTILRPTFQEFLRENYKTMTPIEFMSINKSVSPELFLINYQIYLKELQNFMSLPQKVYLALEANRYAKMKITKARIMQILTAEGENLDYVGVLKIGKLIQNICEQDKGSIGQILKQMNKIVERKEKREKTKN